MQFEIDEESIDLWSNIEIAKIANQRVEIYDTPNLPSSCAIFQYEESTSPTANKSSSIKTVVNERTREAISHDIFQVATAGPMLWSGDISFPWRSGGRRLGPPLPRGLRWYIPFHKLSTGLTNRGWYYKPPRYQRLLHGRMIPYDEHAPADHQANPRDGKTGHYHVHDGSENSPPSDQEQQLGAWTAFRMVDRPQSGSGKKARECVRVWYSHSIKLRLFINFILIFSRCPWQPWYFQPYKLTFPSTRCEIAVYEIN